MTTNNTRVGRTGSHGVTVGMHGRCPYPFYCPELGASIKSDAAGDSMAAVTCEAAWVFVLPADSDPNLF